MSEPKRYDVGMTTENNPHGFNHSFPWVYEAEQGKFVEYSDYDRLKAECQARQAENSVLAVECDSLKAEVERLTADLNKMTKTPDGVDYVEVDVSFWTKSGSRLPQSYSTFWSNDKGVQS